MTGRRKRTPAYRKHKASGQAIVTIDGKDLYLGPFGSQRSKIEYDRLVGEWLANGQRRPGAGSDGLTVTEVVAGYLRHARTIYKESTLTHLKPALALLRRRYGHTLASDFGPLALKALIAAWIDEGHARTTVNKRASWIKAVFRWAVSDQLVEPSIAQGLAAVPMLRKHRSPARETEPVKPVADDVVEATLAHAPPCVAAMARLQRLTGMRPSELCNLTTGDLDTSGKVWIARLMEHKTQHHGHERVVAIGPRGQDVLRPYLRADLSAPIFQPKEAEAERSEERRRQRKTPVQPSQRSRNADRKKRKRRRAPGERYDKDSYRATELRKTHGIDAAGVALGHRRLSTTEVYAERDMEAAMRIAMESG